MVLICDVREFVGERFVPARSWRTTEFELELRYCRH